MLSKTKQELNDDKTISSLIQSAESWTVDLPSSIPYSNNEDDVEFGFELHDDGIDRLTHSTSSFQSICLILNFDIDPKLFLLLDDDQLELDLLGIALRLEGELGL